MNLMEAILTRRSVRTYLDKKVDLETIKEIVKAGMFAPSARNQQCWEFVIITDPEKLKEISHRMETARMAFNAGFAVLICANPDRYQSPDYFSQDCAASIQNMMLASVDKGIGSVWIGVYPKQERMDILSQICDLPSDIVPHSLMVAGYLSEPLSKADRFHPEYIHINHW